MLNKNHVIRSQSLSQQCLRNFSHSSCNRRYNPRRAASPPTLPEHEGQLDPSRPSQALPLPPILDSKVISAKRRLTNSLPKPPQNVADLTDFQKRLAANPYAQALATPVRSCSFTEARLPQHFLLPLKTEFHRQEGSKDTTKLLPTLTLQTEKTSRGLKTSVINSRALLNRLGKKKAFHRLINRDMHDRFKVKDKRNWSWPEGIDSLVLQHLRQSVFAKLKWAFDTPTARLVTSLEKLGEGSADASCTLLLRRDECSTAVDGDLLPAFDLNILLGEDLVTLLVQGTSFADCRAVALADSHPTTAMRVRLLKLQAFMDDSIERT
ncbi:hypothetical protein BDV97DRAFT_397224 [Delphinella strobiligena]|nr:hypothetical protein BDV97DRAFT_397224 [Delphinella strobiligena]